jgi:Phage integrase, N-terminal SAM-like domain
VAVNLKGRTTRAAESHLRANIIPKLGSLPLTEINTETIQSFVAYLATGGRSRKTVENALLTLSSILRVARSWDYACGSFKLAAITMPREGIRKEQRCLTARSLPLRRFLGYASVRLLHSVSGTLIKVDGTVHSW